jgi:predicted DNA-binding transcriptional regulator AlpA
MNSPSSNIEVSRKLSVVEAARHLGLSKSLLDKLRLTGGGPIYLKLGPRRVVYDLADLEQWAAERRRRSTSEGGAR